MLSLLIVAQLGGAALGGGVPIRTPVAPLKMSLAPTVAPGCEDVARPSSTVTRDVNGARQLLAAAQESALQGDRAAARATLERAIERDPLDERVALELSRLLEETPSAVNDAAARARAITITCRGLALSGTQRGREELTARIGRLLTSAQRTKASDATTRFASGLAAARRGQWTLAADAFGDAERLSPSAAEAPFNRAVSLIMAGRRPDALQALEKYLELAPSAPERVAIARSFGTLRRPVHDPGATMLRGLLPGGGQFATGRTAAGVLVLGTVAGATAVAFVPQRRERSVPYIDPNGVPVPYTERYTERPYLIPALGGAAVLTLVAAWESYGFAVRSAVPVRLTVAQRPGALFAIELHRR